MTDPKTDLFSVSIGRQPIFDPKRRLWGYELFCVGNSGDSFTIKPDLDSVALDVASSTYIGIRQVTDQGKKLMIGFTEKSILSHLPYALPPVLLAVKVPEHFWIRDGIPESLHQLKKDGFLIAVDHFSGLSDYRDFYAMADILCLDLSSPNYDILRSMKQKADAYEALIMAVSIPDRETVKICDEIGFSLFHGAFYKTPEKIVVRKLSSNEISRFQLLKVIEVKEPNPVELGKVIQADASISFRLLAYLNSAAFGFSQSIRSIHQAVGLLGWKQMKKWLQVVILSDMGRRPDAPELLALSAQRGKFLEKIAEDHDYWGFSPDSLFLLGLFSLLDALLGLSMKEIVDHLPMDNKLKKGLVRNPGSEYFPLLELARLLEEARWPEGEELMQNLNLDHEKVRAAFKGAVDWANEIAAFQPQP